MYNNSAVAHCIPVSVKLFCIIMQNLYINIYIYIHTDIHYYNYYINKNFLIQKLIKILKINIIFQYKYPLYLKINGLRQKLTNI